YCGALVVTVPSARAALKALSTVTPDILLTEVTMPHEDGYWLLREVRGLAAERGGRIPAIALTGHTRDHSRQRLLAAGFDACLPKPVEPWDLCRTIASLLTSR
ncbi:MAG: response regulator, partial [Candidatus Rokuibacteriota bacterium]